MTLPTRSASSRPRAGCCCSSARWTSRAGTWRERPSIVARTPPFRPAAKSMFRTATETRGCTCSLPDGKLLLSWGEPGTRPGQFNVVHSICVDVDGWVYVADRENHRVQVFDRNGRFETQWNNLHRPCGMYMRAERGALCYIAEAGTGLSINRHMPNIGPRVCVLALDGKQLAQLGSLPPGQGLTASCRCMASRRIHGATSTWARRLTTVGRRCSPASPCRQGCARSAS